jgi:hypothetical protein
MIGRKVIDDRLHCDDIPAQDQSARQRKTAEERMQHLRKVLP